MTELKAVVYNHGESKDPHRYSIHFDRFPSIRKTKITSEFHNSSIETLSVHDCVIVRFAITLLSEGAPKVEPDAMHVGSSTKLKWTSFQSHQMGRGLVAYQQSIQEKDAGGYDPHTALIHEYAENTNPEVMRVVENECAMLAYLLNKFRFDNDFISEQAKSCAVYPEVMRLPEFKWKELPAGTYKIRGILKTGRARYTLVYEKGDRKDELFLHNVEPTAQIDDSLLDTEVVATVLKLPDWSAALLAVEPYTKL